MMRWVRGWSLFDWVLLVIVITFAASQFSYAVDWVDRRSCRTNGGRVIESEHHDWRCATTPPERAP